MGTPPSLPFQIEPLDKRHNRTTFSSGCEPLDRYLQRQASQETRRHVAVTFVLVDTERQALAGYYTLSATSIRLGDLPPETAGKLPRYPLVSATLLGRLAIDTRYQGKGWGEFLLMDALRWLAGDAPAACLHPCPPDNAYRDLRPWDRRDVPTMELLPMLDNEQALRTKINEAMRVLNNMNTK